jgi:hypothetical protein
VLAVAFAARAEAVESHPDSLMILARADVGAGETDLPILDVRYEEVVTDPGTQFPRFIGFLGLDWDEGCTRFHESRRTVRTLSYDQVNRPLYSSSVERWRNYERHLKGVACPGSP